MAANTTHVSSAEENHSCVAKCAFVFSVCTFMTCGLFGCLIFSMPALILSILALESRGRSQKSKAGISIGLNVAVVVCTVVLLVALVTPIAVRVGTRYCPSYYSSTYRTYCVPYSSITSQDRCRHHQPAKGGYCPSTSTYRCPDSYTYRYNRYCAAYGYSSCSYYSSSSPSSGYRECPNFHPPYYHSYCVADRSYTQSSTPCTYSTAYGDYGGYCPT